MRKREIRGYSRTSGIQFSRSSQVRNGGLVMLIIGFVIGVCGLATTVTQQTDRLVAATANQNAIDATSTVDTHATNAPIATPATTLETLPVPPTAKSQPSNASSYRKPSSCNSTKRMAAVSQRAQQLRIEARRHSDAMWSLQTTGLVAKFLNPYMYNKRLNQEIAAHKAVLKQIQQTYAAKLIRANC